MKLADVIAQINDYQKQIDAFGELDSELLKRINYKFRLDWNYYSNHIEGGTLTKDETRSVMIGNIDIHGKSLKDVFEMKGHDKTVLDVLKMGKGEQRFSENRIKQFHKAIMHEDDPEKVRLLGEWKEKANEIINYKGEKIDFTLPEDVKDQMHVLLSSLNAKLDKVYSGKSEEHPLAIAGQFHIDFVSIHPFYDGNGRMSRILTNMLLISFGYPPVIIKDHHKSRYNSLLADIQVYSGQPDLFYTFIGERLIESQQLVLRALKGESIDEEDDLDKEIDLWIRQQEPEKNDLLKRSDERIIDVYAKSLKPLFETYIERHKTFERLFVEMKIYNQFESAGNLVSGVEYFDKWITFLKEQKRIIQEFENDNTTLEAELATLYHASDSNFSRNRNVHEIGIRLYFHGFKSNGVNYFDTSNEFIVKFEEFHYHVKHRHDHKKEYFRKLYSEQLSQTEIDSFVKDRLKETFEEIKRLKEEMGNNQ